MRIKKKIKILKEIIKGPDNEITRKNLNSLIDQCSNISINPFCFFGKDDIYSMDFLLIFLKKRKFEETVDTVLSVLLFLDYNLSKENFLKLMIYYFENCDYDDKIKVFKYICEQNKTDYLDYLLEGDFFIKDIGIYAIKQEILDSFIYNNDITKLFIVTVEVGDYEILNKLIYCLKNCHYYYRVKYFYYLEYIDIIIKKDKTQFNNKILNDKILIDNCNNENLIKILLENGFRPFLSRESLSNKLMRPYSIELLNIILHCLFDWSVEEIDFLMIEFIVGNLNF